MSPSGGSWLKLGVLTFLVASCGFTTRAQETPEHTNAVADQQISSASSVDTNNPSETKGTETRPRELLDSKAAVVREQNSTADTDTKNQKASSKESQGPLYLPRRLAEVLRLSKAGISDDVVIAYIDKAPFEYYLTSGQIVKLTDLGVSPKVIRAMLEHKASRGTGAQWAQTGPEGKMRGAAPAQAPNAVFIPGPPPLPAQVSFPDFFAALAPYGQWLNLPGIGWCWRPAVAADSSWAPYADNGYWLWSDNGWYWNSGYSWGWAPFHYGRWTHRSHQGWLWCPDTKWSPGWVSWRRDADYSGWAALPPESHFGLDGWKFQGSSVGSDCDFDLSASDFVFVPHTHFADQHWQDYRLSSPASDRVFAHTTPENKYSFAPNHHVMNWAFDESDLPPGVRTVSVVDRSEATGNDPADWSNLADNSDPIGSAARMGMYSDTWPGPMGGSDFSGGFSGGGGDYYSGGSSSGTGSGDLADSGEHTGMPANWHSGAEGSHRNDAHGGGHQTAGSGTGADTPTPWLPLGQSAAAAGSGSQPYGVFGSHYQPSPDGSPWMPFGVEPSEPAPGGPWAPFLSQHNTGGHGHNSDQPLSLDDIAREHQLGGWNSAGNHTWGRSGSVGQRMQKNPANQAQTTPNNLGHGHLGHGTLGHGWLGGVPQSSSGSTPWLAFGQNPSSGSGQPYGVYGVPQTSGSGGSSWLPLGTEAANNSGAPFGTYGLGMANGYGHGYGPHVPRTGGYEGGFQYLPAPPTLPAAPILPRSPTLPNAPLWPSFAYLGRYLPSARSAPLAPSARSWPSAGNPGGGWHGGGGGHAWGIAPHAGGGGGHAIGGGGGGHGGGGGGGGGGHH